LSQLEFLRPGDGYDRPALADPALMLTTGKALGQAGQAPACIVNTVGKGRAVLLNFAPHSSFRFRADTRGLAGTAPLNEIPKDAAMFFLNLFHTAGVERAFNFTQYKQEKVPFFPNVKVQRWQNGGYQIVGFFRQTDTQMRRGSFITQINPGSPSLYALLPGPLPPISATVPKQARRGTPIRVKLSVPQARGLHCIELRARRPDGQPAQFWDQSVLVGRQTKEITLPLAWNDPTGEWTVTFTDLFNDETEVVLKVEVK